MDVDQWVRSLVLRVAGPKANVEKHVEQIAPTLVDVSTDAFNDASLAGVAKTLRSVASASRVRKALFDWHSRQRQEGERWPGGDDPTLTLEDRIVLAVWQQHRTDGFSHMQRGDLRQRMTISLDVTRLHHPRVFRYVCRSDLEAASIAVQRGWQIEPESHRQERTPEELEAVSTSVRRALAAIHARPLFHEPGNNDLPQAPPPPSPRHLMPEQLDQLNPLPNGRKRTDATPDLRPAAATPDAADRHESAEADDPSSLRILC